MCILVGFHFAVEVCANEFSYSDMRLSNPGLGLLLFGNLLMNLKLSLLLFGELLCLTMLGTFGLSLRIFSQ
jgi:hypothetical protein